MRGIHILKTGITSLNTDALVNAANSSLLEGAGVCGIIFKAAGASELQKACNAIGGCEIGSAVITPGFNLKSKYIIHAVGPRWTDGKHKEPQLLYSAYTQSLLLAKQYGCSSIGFPLISAGIFGYPVDQAWHKAIQACVDFLKNNPDTALDIQFAVIDDKVLAVGQKKLAELGKENTTLLLKQLEKDSYQNVRKKISQKTDLIIDKKEHPMAGGLMEVLTDPSVITAVSVDNTIKMIEAIFPSYILEEGWIIKYSDMLLRVIDTVKKSNAKKRAQDYETQLRGVLIPMLRDKAHSGTVQDDLMLLADIYKVTTCLYRYYSKLEKAFSFSADRESMDSLNQAVVKVTSIGNQVLGRAFAPVKTEERQYATFLSWILEEIVLKQEEPKEDNESWVLI